jgi:hypothetical protein
VLRKALALGALAALIGALAACEDAFDDSRQPVDTGSFGTTVYTLACKRVAFTSDLGDGDGKVDVSGDAYRAYCRSGTGLPAKPIAAVQALGDQRRDLIAAVDATFPKGFLDPLQAFLSSATFLPVYDDGTAQKAADRLAAGFDTLAKDGDFTAAMARLDGRLGYRAGSAQGGVLPQVSAYPQLDATLLKLGDALAPGGPAHDALVTLETALGRELLDAQPASAPTAPERTLALARDLLLGERAGLTTGKPSYLVARDARGLALVAKPIAAPFVDKDGDGLADADASGRFVDASGQPISAPTPFAVAWKSDGQKRDSAGRAVNAQGQPLYQYLDLDQTVLVALARDLPDLANPTRGTVGNLVRGAVTLLGKRQMVTKTFTNPAAKPLAYRGFDPSTSALLDLTYGFLHVLTDPHTDDTLGLLRALAQDHEAQAARLLEAIFDAADVAKTFPDARLEPGSPLYDDLMAVVLQILNEPGLAEDLLRALEDPATRPLGKIFANLMRDDDAITLDPRTQAVVGSLRTPVDRSQSDSGMNRSLMQRVLHLINDSSGVTLCNKQGAVVTFFGFPTTFPYDQCDLLQIDDLAIFYAQSIAYAKDASGNVLTDSKGRPLPKAELHFNLPGYLEPFVTDSLMESQSTIDGFRKHPTPEALNRVLFLQPMPSFLAAAMDPAVCKDGDRYIDQHGGTLPALELGGFYDALRPVLQVFADRDREDLFIDVMVALHKHWPSRQSLQHQWQNPAGRGYAWASDVRSYEPLLIKILDDDALWGALVEGAPTVNAVAAPSGRLAPEVLADAARFVFRPDSNLTNRAGAHTTLTEDGRTVPVLTPWYVLADAEKAKRAQLAAAGAEGTLWQTAISQVVDVLARGEKLGSTWRFKNPRFKAVSVALIDFVRARLAAHRQAGDLAAWLGQGLPADVQRLTTGPVLPAAADFVVALEAVPEAWTAVLNLLIYLNTDGTPPFQPSTAVVADLLQWYLADADLVPLTRAAGKVIDPELGVLDAELTFVQRARHADGKQVLATLLGHLDGELVPGRTPLAVIADAIAEVNRAHPFVDLGKPLSADDYARVLGAVRTFLDDEKRGLARFVAIVKNRNADQ